MKESMDENGSSRLSRTTGGATAGPLDSIEKMVPMVDEVTFWLLVNVVMFLYVGLEELVHGYGPGALLSAGAVVMAVLYLMFWLISKTNRRMADQLILVFSALAVLGDLIYIGFKWNGYFTTDSVFLDVVGLMLFRAAHKALKGP